MLGLEIGNFQGLRAETYGGGGLFRVQTGQPCICRCCNCGSRELKLEEYDILPENQFWLKARGFQLQLRCLDLEVSFLFVSSAAALVLLSLGVGWGGANQGSVGPGTRQVSGWGLKPRADCNLVFVAVKLVCLCKGRAEPRG